MDRSDFVFISVVTLVALALMLVSCGGEVNENPYWNQKVDVDRTSPGVSVDPVAAFGRNEVYRITDGDTVFYVVDGYGGVATWGQ